jgi:hypothetical protein
MSDNKIAIPWEVTEFKNFKRTTVVTSFFTNFLTDIGFRNATIHGNSEYVLIKDNIVHIVSRMDIVQTFLKWLDENFVKYAEEKESIEDVKKSFANKIKSLISTEVLMMIETIEIIPHFDTKDECFLYFKNTVVKCTKENFSLINYDELDGYVFKEQIIPMDFKVPMKDISEMDIPYKSFIYNIANKQQDRIIAFESVIGYMLHRFQNPSISKAVVLLDENINELDSVMGGTGKSIFVKALSKLRPTCNIDGKSFKHTDTFAYQRLSIHENILVINDVQQNVDFEAFYGRITDGFTINKKHKTECFIPFERAPKLIMTSNYYLKSPSGNSTERRRFEIEFSKHYGKHLNVEQEFNHYFFSDWSFDQWNEFVFYMISCVQKFLREGLVDPPYINILQRRLISEVGIELMDFMDEHLVTKDKLHKKELYMEFIRGGYVSARYQPTQKSFTVRVKKYFEYKNISFRETPLNTKVYYEILKPEMLYKPLTIEDVKNEYRTVKTQSHMKKLIDKMKEHFDKSENKIIAVDLETTGLDCLTDEIVSMAISFEKGTAYNIIFPIDKLNATVFVQPILTYLNSKKIIKVFHNAKFDLKFLRNYGIELVGEIHDTMVLDYLLDPNRKTHGLKEISERHLNYRQITFEEMTGSKEIRQIPLDELTKYACEDVDLTFQLYHFINKQLNKK